VRLLPRLRRKPRAGPELDRLSLKELRGRGADLTRPRHVLHFLYFADEATARNAAEAVASAGYEVSVSEPSERVPQWGVRAETTRIVNESTVHAFRPWFEQVAGQHGGEYDGWEAATKP
jgi:regulator of ribonuclease activity B